MIPVLGSFLEKVGLVIRGEVPPGENYDKRLYETAVLNTFDMYGSHKYQHHLSGIELADICNSLNPKPSRILNLKQYYSRPTPPGLLIRLAGPGASQPVPMARCVLGR